MTGDTSIFIRPGYEFRIIDACSRIFICRNRHLLMLVTAFGGFDAVLAAYRHAVAQRYRFFSYGDAMFLERRAREWRIVSSEWSEESQSTAIAAHW